MFSFNNYALAFLLTRVAAAAVCCFVDVECKWCDYVFIIIFFSLFFLFLSLPISASLLSIYLFSWLFALHFHLFGVRNACCQYVITIGRNIQIEHTIDYRPSI